MTKSGATGVSEGNECRNDFTAAAETLLEDSSGCFYATSGLSLAVLRETSHGLLQAVYKQLSGRLRTKITTTWLIQEVRECQKVLVYFFLICLLMMKNMISVITVIIWKALLILNVI